MVKIYTKVGDKGYTKQVTGKMVPKYDLQIEALGAIDELDSWLGYCVTKLSVESVQLKPELIEIQRNLYLLQADLVVKSRHELTQDLTSQMERRIDELVELVEPIKAFILPGGRDAGASLQYARTLARRAERRIAELNEQQETVADEIMQYLNRLSDYLFELARYANQLDGYAEIESKKISE